MVDINQDPVTMLCLDGSGIDSLLDGALGPIAQIFGKPYNVYRIKPASDGDFIQMYNLVDTGFFVDKVRLPPSDKNLVSDSKAGTYWYSLTGDFSAKLVGDVFVCADPNAAGNSQVTYSTLQFDGFGLAQKGVLPIGGRLDRLVTIKRSAMEADSDGYVTNTTPDMPQLVCVDGVFSFNDDPTVTGSLVPAGLMSEKKVSGDQTKGLSESPLKSRFLLYLPPLPGYVPREGDSIIEQSGVKYKVIYPYTQEVGTVGSQLEVERLVGPSNHG